MKHEGLPRDLNLSWNLEDCLDLPTGRLSVVESYGKGINIRFRSSGAIVKARNGGAVSHLEETKVRK